MKNSRAALVGTLSWLASAACLSACGDPAQPTPIGAAGGATGTMGAVGTAGPTTGVGGAATGTMGSTVTGTVGSSTATTSATITTGTTGSTSVGGTTSTGTTTTTTGSPTTGGTSMGAGGSGTTGGGTTGGDMIEASFETFKFIITASNPTCAASDCHGNNEANELDLTIDDELYQNLLNTISDDCGNVPVVDPGNPTGSALVMLLRGPCGQLERMPRGCTDLDGNCIPEEYIVAVEQWIAAGAPEN